MQLSQTLIRNIKSKLVVHVQAMLLTHNGRAVTNMGLETATLIHELDRNNPVGASDPKAQGDNHIRMMKACMQDTLPNVEGVVNASHTELNQLVGVTAPIEQMRGIPWTSQNAPYSVVAADIGSMIDILTAGTVTLTNVANGFACMLATPNADITLTVSTGTLNWFDTNGGAPV